MRYVQNKDVAWRLVQDEAVLVLPRTSEVKVLNEVGSLAWAVWEEPATVEQVAQRVCEEYEVDPETAARDVEAFARELTGKGLLFEREE